MGIEADRTSGDKAGPIASTDCARSGRDRGRSPRRTGPPAGLRRPSRCRARRRARSSTCVGDAVRRQVTDGSDVFAPVERSSPASVTQAERPSRTSQGCAAAAPSGPATSSRSRPRSSRPSPAANSPMAEGARRDDRHHFVAVSICARRDRTGRARENRYRRRIVAVPCQCNGGDGSRADRAGTRASSAPPVGRAVEPDFWRSKSERSPSEPLYGAIHLDALRLGELGERRQRSPKSMTPSSFPATKSAFSLAR